MATPQPCPVCGASLVTVVMHAGERPVTMRSCSNCDRRWWTVDGQEADPTKVFAKRTA